MINSFINRQLADVEETEVLESVMAISEIQKQEVSFFN